MKFVQSKKVNKKGFTQNYNFKKLENCSAGFTLIEILIVIAIIAIIATLAVLFVSNTRQNSRIAKAKGDLKQIKTAIQMLAADTEQWPNHKSVNKVDTSPDNELCGPDKDGNTCVSGSLEDEVAGLTQDDTSNPYVGWKGNYIYPIPLDPWGHEYFFTTDYQVNADREPCKCGGACTSAVVIGSYGPDRLRAPILPVEEETFGCDDIIMILYP